MFYVCISVSLMSYDNVCPSQAGLCAWGLGTAHTSGISARDTPINIDSICPEEFKTFVMVVIMVGCDFFSFYKAHKIIVMLF